MPRLQYVTVREQDLGAGIDQQSAENNIQPGFCENIENADPKSTGEIAKRKGYQGYAGYVPVRVTEYEQDGTLINLTLDENILLPLGASSPLVIKGKTSVASGEFASETTIYYDGFIADIRKIFNTGIDTLTVEQDDHDVTNKHMFVGVTEAISEVDTDNAQFIPDSLTINQTSLDINVGYNNNSGDTFRGYVYAKDKSAQTGVTFVQESNTVNTGSNSFTILQSTHSLDNNNIIVKVYRDDSTDYFELIPDDVFLDDSTGDIQIDITNNTVSSFTAIFILTSTPTVNFSTGSVASGATQSVTIDTSVTGGSPFAFVACYLEPTIGGTLEQVYPTSIISNSDNKTITVTFTNNTASGANFEVFWDFAQLSTNQLSVTGTTSATFTDLEPQLTIWGLCHEEIYGTREAREGWVNHIDAYRAPAENRLISGLGGNLFSAQLRDEGSNSTDLLIPTLYPRLNSRLASDITIGPAFYDTGESPGRTRGFITGDNGSNNFFEITSIDYNAGSTYVEYTLTIPNLVISGTLSSIISTVTGKADKFTAQQCGHSVHNGEFTIKTVANPTSTTLVIGVENTNVDSTDFDETDVGGLGGIFTDQLTFTGTSPFLTGDTIKSDIFDDTNIFTAVNNLGTILVIDGVTDALGLPGGLRVLGQRTNYIVPMRDFEGASTVENLVRGDMLEYSEINRQLRIKSVNQLDDISVTITADGTTATVTLGSGDVTTLFIGKKILLSETSNYNGAQTITDILSLTTFTFDTTLSASDSGTMVGKTVEVDEQLTFQDTTSSTITMKVHSRWIPVEFPEDSYNLTPQTKPRYFDTNEYTNQAILRSTMVQDNLYITNFDDEVMKFDGTNIYRAGLFRWQPNLFVTTDTTATGKIVTDNTEVTFDTSTKNRFEFTTTPEDGLSFKVGDEIKDSQDDSSYFIQNITTVPDSTGVLIKVIIYVDRDISGSSGTKAISRISSFSYYFRLNAIDANENIIASAVTGSEDFVVKLGDDAAVNLKLIGMPAFDIYDYDRLEVQIYRTKANSPAPFYRLTTIAMEFNNDDGYIEYTDTDSDEDLRQLDEVNTALKGAELGTAWEQPLRAKYCTSAGNRLILGNLKDYPTLDMQLIKNSAILTQTTFTTSDNNLWQFRKDNTSTATGTDMLNTARYEFVGGTSVIAGITGTLGTSFNVNVVGHGVSAGDWVYLFHTSVADADQLTYAGWWQINSITDANNFVILSTASLSGAAVNPPNGLAKASTSSDIPVFIGTDGNYAMNNGNRTSSEPYEFLAIRRLADAINASMRKVDISITGFEDFVPWMTANAGNEFNTGQLVIRQPKVFSTFLEMELPALTGDFDIFVNNIKRDGSAQISSLTKLFPSRIIASYQNYPEIFDNPTSTLDTDSDSAIDINSADGQEITAIIPFFGESAFGAAQKSSIVVVFKTNSIYLVDLSAKDRGENPVQRLETRGKGCTAPFSVSVTRGGIMFANDTGVYRLGRDLKVEYIGRKYERIWKETVNKNQLAIATGHHDTNANQYKLSYPLSDASENSKIAVYNHTREYAGKGDGSWTTYTNHSSTGWANLEAESFFSTVDGRVFQVRNIGEDSDYRDDDSAIDMEILTRAMDMLEGAKRKVFSKIITHYRAVSTSNGTTLAAGLDLKTVLQDTDTFNITRELEDTGTADTGSQKVVTIASVINEKVGVYIQLKYTNSTIDEPVEITRIDFRVAAKSSEGITEAAET